MKEVNNAITAITVVNEKHTTKDEQSFLKDKTPSKKIIRHLLHPDYILFDWEFFNNALEFE